MSLHTACQRLHCCPLPSPCRSHAHRRHPPPAHRDVHQPMPRRAQRNPLVQTLHPSTISCIELSSSTPTSISISPKKFIEEQRPHDDDHGARRPRPRTHRGVEGVVPVHGDAAGAASHTRVAAMRGGGGWDSDRVHCCVLLLPASHARACRPRRALPMCHGPPTQPHHRCSVLLLSGHLR
jgi:hypothetical protein